MRPVKDPQKTFLRVFYDGFLILKERASSGQDSMHLPQEKQSGLSALSEIIFPIALQGLSFMHLLQ